MGEGKNERSRRRSKFDFRWAAAFILIVGALAAAILLNAYKPGDIGSKIDIDNGDQKINWDRYQTIDVELTDDYTINQSGIYHLTGNLPDGEITINALGGDIKLILDNVSISNSNGPAITCLATDDLVIELVGDNYLSDGSTYSSSYDEDVNGVIYSKGDLTFQGEGSLKLTANYQDAIVGKDDVKIKSGTYDITSVDDGIRGKDSVYIVSGYFNINSKSDAIKSTNADDISKGFILIEDGMINITAGDDGIHAIQELIIEGGNIDIAKSYEGLEAQVVSINDGDISIYATDDGINAGGGTDNSTTNRAKAFDADLDCSLSINGGNIYVIASGDGVDSNGYIYFNGGTTTIDGPTNNGNGALDSGAGIAMNGGTVIAVGSSGMAEALGNTSGNTCNISVYFTTQQSADTKIEIRDADGNTIISHTSAKTFSHLAAGSSDFALGQTYTIYIDDTEYQTLTISDTTTTIGNGNRNFNNATRQPQR